MNDKKIIDSIKKHEGFRAKIYKCTEGYWTIGYGTNLDAGITKSQASTLLEDDLYEMVANFKGFYPNFDNLDIRYQEFLSEMIYQLGDAGVLHFKKMLAAMEKGDDKEVVKQIDNSKWYSQTPNRIDDMIKLYLAKGK